MSRLCQHLESKPRLNWAGKFQQSLFLLVYDGEKRNRVETEEKDLESTV